MLAGRMTKNRLEKSLNFFEGIRKISVNFYFFLTESLFLNLVTKMLA